MRRAACAVGLTLLVFVLPASAADAIDSEKVYNRACKKCHRTGIDDAPVTGDKAAWAKLMEKGRAELLKSVLEGKGEMGARGEKPELTDEELGAALDYQMERGK